MPRAMWKGAINFGLVNIPIRMFKATQEKNINFHLMSPDGRCRLRRKLYCPETGKEYDFKESSRGFEIAPHQYVLLDEDEIEKLRPESGHSIDIEDFVSLGEIDPLRYDQAYYLAPSEGGGRPYRLLVEAMERMDKVGIARFVLRNKQHLAALRVSQGGLCLSTMHWADEIHALPDVVKLPNDKINPQQLKLATDLIESLTRPFEPDRYENTYRDELMEMIERKAEGKTIALPSEETGKGAEVIDLMEALKRSLNKKGGKKTSVKASSKKRGNNNTGNKKKKASSR